MNMEINRDKNWNQRLRSFWVSPIAASWKRRRKLNMLPWVFSYTLALTHPTGSNTH